MNRPTAKFMRTGLTATVVRTLLVTLLLGFLQIVQGPGFLPPADALETVGTGVCQSSVGNASYVKVYTSATRCILEFDPTTTWAPPVGVASVYFLAVGGGGAGAGGRGGGGGAGGLETGTTSVIGASMTMNVGTGGVGNTGLGGNGTDSYFGLIPHALGGGAGGTSFGATNRAVGGNGTYGSGGGAGIYINESTTGWAGGVGTPGQGNNGGGSGYPYASLGSAATTYDMVRNTAGGGGAGGPGISGEGGSSGQYYQLTRSDLPSTRTPDGGSGLLVNITGTSKCYAAGGGGSYGYFYKQSEWDNYYTAGNGRGGGCGGTAIGGLGGYYAGGVLWYTVDQTSGGAGTANTGSGGGAGNVDSNAYTAAPGGSGGSGVIVVSWLKTSSNTITSPLSTSVMRGDTFTLTASGTSDIAGVTRTWQWQRSTNSGSTWTNIGPSDTKTTTTYTDTGTTTINGYQYRVYFTDSDTIVYDTGTTQVATITVLTPPPTTDTDTVLSLNGATYASSSPTSSIGDTFTIEAWVKPTFGCSGSTNKQIIRKINVLDIYCRDGRFFINAYQANGSTAGTYDFGFNVETNTWQHIAVSRDLTNSAAATLYFNGGAIQAGILTSLSNLSGAWYVGGSPGGSEKFTGQIDEIKVWNTVRTAANIKSDMRTYTPANTSGLIAYWDFNEVSGTSAFDRVTSATGLSDLKITSANSFVENRTEDTTTVTGVTIQIFTRSYLTINGGWKTPTIYGSIRALEVAGGGSGGSDRGGGGGAGGRIYTILNNLPSIETITIGMGGNGGSSSNPGGNGESTTLGTVIAHGGGAGGTSPGAINGAGKGLSGGSGGGGSFSAGNAQDSGTGNTGNYTPPEGYRGAPSLANGNYRNTGGGGGATGVGISGANGDSTTVGLTGTRPDGGPGDTLSITGTPVQYAAGGGGARGLSGLTYPNYETNYFSAPPGLGGPNGCGRGANIFEQYGGDGCYNTGGGGGGGATGWTVTGVGTTMAYGGRGGSGIVVLRYITALPTGDTPTSVTINEGDTPTFTTSSTPVGNLVRGYRWQYETSTGTTWLNVTDGTGYDSSTYTLPQQTNRTRNQYRYRVAITDTDTITGETITGYTESATLTILPAGEVEGDYSGYFSNKTAKSVAPLTFTGSNISAEVWVNRTTACGSASNNYAVYFANVFSIACRSNSWYGTIRTNAGDSEIQFKQTVQQNEWHHLALTLSGTDLYAYYDGQEVESVTGVVFSPSANNYLYVGDNGNNSYHTGNIDELRIWTSSRRSSISTDIYTLPDTTSATLFAYYNFNETGTIVHDRTSNAIGTGDLIATGGPWTWQTIETSTVVGTNRLYQFPRTIITSQGGWALPKSSTSPTALVVGAGGGGTGNAGYGGAGGGLLKGKVSINNTTSRLKIQVGVGGINSYSFNSAVATAPIFVGGTGGTSSIISADNPVNAVVTGGVGGPNHWKDNRCQNPTSGTELANYNASPSAGGTPTSTTGITVQKSFTGTGGGLIDPAQGAPSDAASGIQESITGTTHLYGGGGGSGGWNIAGSAGGGDNGNAAGGSGNAGGTPGDNGQDAYAYYGGGGGGGGDSCQINGGRGAIGVVYLLYPLNAMDFINPTDTKTSVGQVTSFSIGGDTQAGFTRSYQWQKQDSGTTTWSDVDLGSWQFFDFTTSTLNIGNPSNLIADKSLSGSKFRAKITDTNNSTGDAFSAFSESATLTIYDQFVLTGGGGSIRTPFGTPASTPAFTSTGGVLPTRWSLVNPPTGVTIDSVTAILTAGNTTQPASYVVTLKATDAAGAALTESASVYVGSQPILMVGDVFSWVDTGTSFSIAGRSGVSTFENVTIDRDGNVYGFGKSDAGFTMNGTGTNSSAGYQFVKINKSGVVQWIKYAKAENLNLLYARIWGKKIVVDILGNIYFAASGSAKVTFDTTTILFNSLDYPCVGDFIVKMDSSGAVTWIARLDSPNQFGNSGALYGTTDRQKYGDIRGLAVDSNGNVYAAGVQASNIGFASPSQIATNSSCNDPAVLTYWAACGTVSSTVINGENYYEVGYVLKMNSTGDLQWAYNMASSPANSVFASVDVDQNDNLLLTGTVDDPATYRGDPTTSSTLNLSARISGYGKFFAMKLDSDGNAIWVSQDGGGISGMSTFYPAQGDQAFTGFIDPAGSVYVAGATYGGSTLQGVARPNKNGSTKYYAAVAIKFDNAGNVIWAKQETATTFTDASWISGGADQNGNAYFLGNIKDGVTLNGTSYNYTGKTNPIVEYSANGTPLYLSAYGGTNSAKNTILAISVDHLGNIAAAGTINDTTTLDSFSFIPKTAGDAFIGMLRNNSSAASASLSTKYGTPTKSPAVVVFGGTAPFVITLRNTYSGKVTFDTSSGVSITYANASSLIPGTYAESITVVDALAQTYTLAETITVAKADTVTVTPATLTGLVYNNGDTLSAFETITVTPLVNSDTVTTVTYFSGTANSGDTYSATNTVMPKKAGTYTVTPLITAVSYGTVSAGQLSYYQYTKYETATLTIGRATRPLRIDNADYSNVYAAAVNETITMYATGVGNDTVTVTWTLAAGSCVLSSTGKLFASVTTACIVVISVPQTANYLAASDTRTINFYLFTSGFNGSGQNAGGSHTIFLGFENRLETTTITIAADSSTTTIAPVIAAITQASGGVGTGISVTLYIDGTYFWTTAGSLTVTFGRNVSTRDATSYITARTPTRITLVIPDSYMTANGFSTGSTMGRASVSTPAGSAGMNTPTLTNIVINI